MGCTPFLNTKKNKIFYKDIYIKMLNITFEKTKIKYWVIYIKFLQK